MFLQEREELGEGVRCIRAQVSLQMEQAAVES